MAAAGAHISATSSKEDGVPSSTTSTSDLRALPTDYQKILKMLDSHRDHISNEIELVHEQKREKLEHYYPFDIPQVLQDFHKAKERITLENYIPIIGLLEVLEHLGNRSALVTSGKTTFINIQPDSIIIHCNELTRQCGPRFSLRDSVKLVLESEEKKITSITTTFSQYAGDRMTFTLRSKDKGKIVSQRLVGLINQQKDIQLILTLEKLLKLPKEIIQYILPETEVITQIQTRSNWKYDVKDLSPRHTDFVKKLCRYKFQNPYICAGVAGSGKSAAIARLICTLLDNEPKIRIVIASRNNTAIDSLMLRIHERRPKAKLTRYCSKFHGSGDDINSTLAVPPIYCDTIAEAKEKYERTNILGLTVAKALNLEVFPKCDFLILEEAGLSFEFDFCNVIKSFADLTSTTTLLAGDPYQLKGLATSEGSIRLGIQTGTLHRLIDTNPIYNVKRADTDILSSITILNICYRCPIATTTEILQNLYPFPVFPVPVENENQTYWFLKDLPPGPMNFHHIQGSEKHFSNNNKSLSNPEEVAIIIRYLDILINTNNVPFDKILVMTYYFYQVLDIMDAIIKRGWTASNGDKEGAITVSCMYKIQGMTRSIVLLSLCQSYDKNKRPNMGKYLQQKPMNTVALSRHESALHVFADRRLVSQSRDWRPILKYEIDYKKFKDIFLKNAPPSSAPPHH